PLVLYVDLLTSLSVLKKLGESDTSRRGSKAVISHYDVKISLVREYTMKYKLLTQHCISADKSLTYIRHIAVR
ncbi:hypothetical protein CGH34_25000, partial [Vibrio parahaemolyticus]